MNYEPVIGLEVHVELNTKTKMFCRCSAQYFGKQPNTHTCPVCIGLPGALPFINESAIESCIKIGLALDCQIQARSLFERKNYFYPDLPKGYQISQLRWPLCINGSIELEGKDGQVSTIRINRVHQEEDTGKLTHSGSDTLIDFNRSGVPLAEIVTEPDFKDPTQVRDYAKKLQQIFRYLGVSNADMERGDMRLEANISVRPEGQTELPNYRVELKNINSFRFMVAAVEYEIKRQIEALEKGEKLVQETRGWDEDKKRTFVQRSKEEANDYRYFPEPDLLELKTDSARVEELKLKLPELPWQKAKRWEQSFGIPMRDGVILSDSSELANYFDAAVNLAKDAEIEPKQIANFIINKKVDIEKMTAQQIIDEIKSKQANVLDDDAEIEKLVREVISENAGIVEQYKAGKVNVLNALVGMVMRKSGGKANTVKVKEIFSRLLI